MSARCRTLWRGLLVTALLIGGETAHAFDWIPATPDELLMTKEPKAPGAPAIYLYRQVERDDNGPDEINFVRIKILTEAGRQFANVELAYEKSTEHIEGIIARTVHADGSIIKFDGTVYEKPILQTLGRKLLAKTFTLPDVQVGSIIEYRFQHNYARGYVYDSHWFLSQNLFTRHAKFSLNPYRGFPMRYSWPVGLPPGTDPPQAVRTSIRLETSDVPAFIIEEHMPPADALMFRVDFIYLSDGSSDKDPTVFWRKFGKRKFAEIDRFLDKRSAMTDAVATIVEPADSAEVKIHKIYARVQRLRNLSFERNQAEQEKDRESLKNARNVDDVWKHGYGTGEQLTWLFLALARAAGMQADPVVISMRDRYFFSYAMMNSNELSSNVAMLMLNGNALYLDPGVAFAPFGVLPWGETAVKGLRLDKDGGTWITTALPAAAESRIERNGVFQLLPNSTLKGKVTVTYTGQQALWRRLEERHEDDSERQQFLENQLQSTIPSGVDVKLTNKPDWESSAPTLVAEYDLEIPGWATAVGQRMLFPNGVFAAEEKHAFQTSVRTQILYFNFPYQTEDQVSVTLPQGWQVSSLPQSRSENHGGLVYSTSADVRETALHFSRALTMDIMLLPVTYYPSLKGFFEAVRNGDEERAVLVRSQTSATR